MIVLHNLPVVLILLVPNYLITGGNCDLNPDALGAYKDLLQQEKAVNPSSGSMVEDDYPLPSYVWTPDYDTMTANKRSSKFKNYMLTKDADAEVQQQPESSGSAVIRSYIPRTSAKRGPGAILNWALSPNQQKAGRFYSGFYRSQAHLRPAALE